MVLTTVDGVVGTTVRAVSSPQLAMSTDILSSGVAQLWLQKTLRIDSTRAGFHLAGCFEPAVLFELVVEFNAFDGTATMLRYAIRREPLVQLQLGINTL